MLFNGEGTHVLLEENNKRFLPELHIPQFTRPAEQITSVLRNTWSIPAVLLFSNRIEADEERPYYAAVEACRGNWDVPAGLAWYPIERAASTLVEGEASLLRTSHAKAVQPHFGVDPAPFGRLGWLHRLHDWVKTTVAPLGIELTHVSQLNGSETFCLLRFDTTKEPLWFKAVGRPNLHEFPITLTLSRLFPDYVPTILSSDPLLNGWLMDSAGELTLVDVDDHSIWQKAIQRLAQLQIKSVSHIPELLQAECRDLRTKTLADLVDPFFECVRGLMERQTKTRSLPLTAQELSTLASNVKLLLASLAELGIPDTLGHSDFNPGNILLAYDRYVFTDWAEGSVGHPFLTFEYFLAHLRKSFPALAGRADEFREAYSKEWLPTVPAAGIVRGLQIMAAIAPYAYALSGDAWRDPSRLNVPPVPALLRSLARKMNQEVNSLKQLRDLCLI